MLRRGEGWEAPSSSPGKSRPAPLQGAAGSEQPPCCPATWRLGDGQERSPTGGRAAPQFRAAGRCREPDPGGGGSAGPGPGRRRQPRGIPKRPRRTGPNFQGPRPGGQGLVARGAGTEGGARRGEGSPGPRPAAPPASPAPSPRAHRSPGRRGLRHRPGAAPDPGLWEAGSGNQEVTEEPGRGRGRGHARRGGARAGGGAWGAPPLGRTGGRGTLGGPFPLLGGGFARRPAVGEAGPGAHSPAASTASPSLHSQGRGKWD